ncbi:hypothetical protein K466DRAFT_570513 [Polyporus arcularius HHB13444]|uniref:Uncharacterized protein n=1 Tax=Polyporus arcularius HHB13444 TaxID=1314778 RepID=A0A5C3NNY4_9APHY|nr:hypothetical protein K466DRAFT_570513 [Polyporus arcularius HHB13444]
MSDNADWTTYHEIVLVVVSECNRVWVVLTKCQTCATSEVADDIPEEGVQKNGGWGSSKEEGGGRKRRGNAEQDLPQSREVLVVVGNHLDHKLLLNEFILLIEFVLHNFEEMVNDEPSKRDTVLSFRAIENCAEAVVYYEYYLGFSRWRLTCMPGRMASDGYIYYARWSFPTKLSTGLSPGPRSVAVVWLLDTAATMVTQMWGLLHSATRLSSVRSAPGLAERLGAWTASQSQLLYHFGGRSERGGGSDPGGSNPRSWPCICHQQKCRLYATLCNGPALQGTANPGVHCRELQCITVLWHVAMHVLAYRFDPLAHPQPIVVPRTKRVASAHLRLLARLFPITTAVQLLSLQKPGLQAVFALGGVLSRFSVDLKTSSRAQAVVIRPGPLQSCDSAYNNRLRLHAEILAGKDQLLGTLPEGIIQTVISEKRRIHHATSKESRTWRGRSAIANQMRGPAHRCTWPGGCAFWHPF